ncbi:MAG: hypothetical protein ACFFE3_01345, partial [Candidatus Thorarchaeota archaeon]
MSEDEGELLETSISQRIRYILIEPSETIDSDVIRVKARLLSFALLLTVIVLPVIQLILDILVENITIFSLATIIFFLIYLLSRTKYVRIAGIVMTLTLASMPYLFLLVEFNQTPVRLTMNVIIWPVIAALFGSQWLSSRFESLLILGETTGLLIYCDLNQAIELATAFEPIVDQAAISLVVLFFSWALNYYIAELEEHKQFLEQRQREL